MNNAPPPPSRTARQLRLHARQSGLGGGADYEIPRGAAGVSAIIPLLWRAQEQEGWLSRPAIEHVCDMLGMAHIRGLEVATFYFMFQLQPVGSVAHLQICGTTSCMICGAEDLVAVCKDKIAKRPHEISADGKFSWEEVECLGACANAPMAQIGKDYYEDLTAEGLAQMIDDMAAGKVPVPGPQNGRYASEPASGLTSLTEYDAGKPALNVSATLATEIGDTIKRIDGTEVPLVANWGKQSGGDTDVIDAPAPEAEASPEPAPAPATAPEAAPVPAASAPTPAPVPAAPSAEVAEAAPERLDAPQGDKDDLKQISGVGPKLETLLNEMGFWHFRQIAAWGPAEIAWVDARLKFKGRIERDNWVAQATELAKG